MSSKFLSLFRKKIIKTDSFIAENLQYEVLTGSVSYGVSEIKWVQGRLAKCVKN